MPTPPLSDELAREAVELYKEYGEKAAPARILGIDRRTFAHRLKIAEERGMAVGPDIPDGHRIKGVSTLTDAEGRVISKWTKTAEGEFDPDKLGEIVRGALESYDGHATPIQEPNHCGDLLTLFPFADFHIGMFGWHKEVGIDWDLKIADRVLSAGIADLIRRTPPSAECIILGGGDLLHSDNNENRTSRSGNILQVDGRYEKVIDTAVRLMLRAIDHALDYHGRVTVRILKGNHDEHACIAIVYALREHYRDEPRVFVDTDPGLFWWHRFGQVLLGATHGHEAKLGDMPGIMAHRRAEDWGRTKFRYVHGFHMHHKRVVASEGGGCVAEIHQAPIPQDAWHYGKGFLSGRSMQAITYHKHFGEIGRTRVAMLDAGDGT